MTDNPISRKQAAEARVKVCRQEIQKLRDPRSRISPPKVSPWRDNHGSLSFEDVQLIDTKALRAFLINNLEVEALRYEREANRLRFEVIAWAEEQRSAMQAEIAAFNKDHLK